jgi:hypothetical protein
MCVFISFNYIFMTKQKKLIVIGVAASLLTALFVWSPG